MKTNQETLVKEEKRVLHQIQAGCTRRQEAQGTRFCIRRGETWKDKRKGWPKRCSTDWGIMDFLLSIW